MSDLTVLYYSANRAGERMLSAVRERLHRQTQELGFPVIAVTQARLYPHHDGNGLDCSGCSLSAGVECEWAQVEPEAVKRIAGVYPICQCGPFGLNIDLGDLGASVQNVYRQILIGAKAAQTEFVCCAEDDMFYSREHLAYRPAPGVFAYNVNRWHLDGPDETRPARYRWRSNRSNMSGCVCHRQDLIDTLEARFKADPDAQHAKSWGEPGRYEWKFGIPRVTRETFSTTQPIIHVNHGGLFGIRKRVKTDVVADTLPGWPPAVRLWEEVAGRG